MYWKDPKFSPQVKYQRMHQLASSVEVSSHAFSWLLGGTCSSGLCHHRGSLSKCTQVC